MSVYFFQGGPSMRDPIKIGWARSVVNRYGKIQAGCPHGLYLIAGFEGSKWQESVLHTRFSHLRLRSEWFYAADDLVDFIKSAISKKSISKALNDDFAFNFGAEGGIESYSSHSSVGPYGINLRLASWVCENMQELQS